VNFEARWQVKSPSDRNRLDVSVALIVSFPWLCGRTTPQFSLFVVTNPRSATLDKELPLNRSATDVTPEALSITDLTMYLKGVVEETFPSVWVVGEISNLSRPRSGHVYMTLKDDLSQIRGVMWRSTASKLRFDLQEGQQVLAFGGIEVYGPQGVYQIVLRKMEPIGLGALQLAFQQLQQRLQAEGLFDPAKKKRLPPFPRRIGVVTSTTGAAVRDFLEIAMRRWPNLDVTIIPAKVQGPGAAQTIVAGINAAHRLKPPLDVLVVTRGGGSMEDLWCFNEESVVRAIAASRIPIVSAVGHEIDITLSDFAADVRALTPSEAAERIVPEYAAVYEAVVRLSRRLNQPLWQRIHYHKEQLRQLSQRPVFRRPHELVLRRSQQLDELEIQMRKASRKSYDQQTQRLRTFATMLSALSPLGVLARGYSITRNHRTGETILSSHQVSQSDEIYTQTNLGGILSRVVSSYAE